MRFKARHIVYFIVFSVPLVLRLLPYREFITPDRVYFYGPDSYDHMRRVFLILNDFPKIPLHNYYQGYPVGSPNLLSPLYDFMIAFIAKLVGFGSPSTRTVELVGVFLPAIIGMLSIAMVYILAREFMDKRAAIFSALFFGIMPGYLCYSTVGQPDNNVIEPLIGAIYFYLLIRMFRVKDWRAPLYAFLAGCAGVMSILLWRGATQFWVIGLMMLIVLHVVDPKDGRTLRLGGIVFGIKGIVFLGMALGGILAVRSYVSFREVSYFHAILSLTISAGFLSAYSVRKIGFSKRVLIYESIMFLIPVALVAVLVPAFSTEILRSGAMMAHGDIWLEDNIEYQSILFPNGRFNFIIPTLDLSLFFWAVPLGIIWFLRRLLTVGEKRPQMAFLMTSSFVFFLSTLSHLRFENLLAVNVAFLSGMIMERTILCGQKRALRNVFMGLFFIVVSILLVRSFSYSKGPLRVMEIQKEFVEVMDWLRKNTPETSYYYEPHRMPEYGVLAEWSIGSWIENIAKRPAVATNFGAETHGLLDSVEFMLSEDEESAQRVLSRNKVRYVIITNLAPSLNKYARILGIKHRDYANLDEKTGSWRLGERYFRLISTRLFLKGGIGLRHFRLLYESSREIKATGLSYSVKRIKVFEYVPEKAMWH
ncbi:MAG: glycosyltransferase family 39 protein [Nitrospirae bacterium]|nr:glycosyltransferase family 39 protein [Nitrospirota bacterium]